MRKSKLKSVFSKRWHLTCIAGIAFVFTISLHAATFTYEDTTVGAFNNQTSCPNPDGGANGATVIANLVRTITVTNSCTPFISEKIIRNIIYNSWCFSLG